MDWTAGRTSESRDTVHSDEEAEKISEALGAALDAADVVWWLVPPFPSQSHTEWALAVMAQKATVTSGPELSRRAFVYRPKAETHFHTDDLALAYVVDLIRARAN
jgi:hypothetical protein